MTADAALPSPTTPSRALWLVPAALALHNLEEAVTLPRYLPVVREHLPVVLRPIAARLDASSFRLALLWVTLLALLMTAAAFWRWNSRPARWGALAVQAVVALNVVSHVFVSIVLLRGYTPGLVTALVVNAPISIHLFQRAARERWIPTWSWWLLPPAAAILHGPGLLGLLLLA